VLLLLLLLLLVVSYSSSVAPWGHSPIPSLCV
jgi:hypothetical protein